MKRRLKKKKASVSYKDITATSPAAVKEEPAETPADTDTADEPLQIQSTGKKDGGDKKAAAAKERVVKRRAAENVFVQFKNYEFSKKQIEAEIKKQWKQSGSPIKDMNTLDMYVKPEEGRVYYLINGSSNGYLQLF